MLPVQLRRSLWLGLLLVSAGLAAACETPMPAGGGSLESYANNLLVPPTSIHVPVRAHRGGGGGALLPPGPGAIHLPPGYPPPYLPIEGRSDAGPDLLPGDSIGGQGGGLPKMPVCGLRRGPGFVPEYLPSAFR